MRRIFERIELVLAGALLFTLLFSLCFHLFTNRHLVQRVLFFPGLGTPKLSGEERLLPLRRGLEENVTLLVDELILGPARPEHFRMLPRKTQVVSVIWREGVLYLNLSKDAVFPDLDVRSAPEEIIQGVGNTVLYNFPRIKALQIFVNGQIPRLSGRETEEIHYDKSIFK